MSKKKLGNLVVVGLGYVGLPLALLADRKGWQVTGIDINQTKIKKVNNDTVLPQDYHLIISSIRRGFCDLDLNLRET